MADSFHLKRRGVVERDDSPQYDILIQRLKRMIHILQFM